MAGALCAAAALACLPACGTATALRAPSTARATPPAPTPAAPTALETTLTSAQSAWEGRWEPEALARAIAKWREALGMRGAMQAAVQTHLAAAHHFHGSAILSLGGDVSAAREAFEAGVQAAVAARAGAEDAGATDAAPSEALYWWAANRAAAAAQTDFAQSVLVQQEVVQVMQRCADAECPYDHGGAHRFLGSHHARPLGDAHRDLGRARQHFDRALAAAPQHLPTRIAFARDYAVAAQDRSLFEQQVRHVVEARSGDDDAGRGDTLLAQHQAAALLRAAPNLFE